MMPLGIAAIPLSDRYLSGRQLEQDNVELSDTWTVETIPTSSMSEWVSQLLCEVITLTHLQDNWDSYGSPPPDSILQRALVQLIQWTEFTDFSPPAVVPVPGGGIQLEWIGDSRELELEFQPSGVVAYLAVNNDNTVDEGSFPITDFTTARNWMKWFQEKTC